MEKVVELVGGGSLINGAYPVYFFFIMLVGTVCELAHIKEFQMCS